jgi:hypothetical protein
VKRSFVESHGFSADRQRLEKAGELTLEDMVDLESEIMANPLAGDLVQGTGGLRKMRLGQRAVGRGKSGGCRILFLDLPHVSVTHLLAIFGKREKVDLAVDDRKALAQLVRQIKKETAHEKSKTH